MFSDLAFNARGHGSFLIVPNLVSKLPDTSLFITMWREQ
jgi:hypothetical protein